MKERDLQKQIIRDIHQTALFWAVPVDAKPVLFKGKWIKSRAKSGVPDLLVFCRRDYRIILIEIKKPGKKLNPNQEKFRELCRLNNAACDVAHSSIQALSILHFWCRRWGYHDEQLEAILEQLK